MFSAKKMFEQGWYAKIERAAPLIPGATLDSIWRARNRGIPFFTANCVQFRPPAYCADPAKARRNAGKRRVMSRRG
jgi:hypothetical protein